ncbi:MAG: hypothetical protein K5640_02955 [Treponema sp.]|nr:hypothetical protein [Treponema sp.]
MQKLLNSFTSYYNVVTNDVEKPFCARAEFHSHSEQFFLVKAAKVADIDSNEYVYFYQTKNLTPIDIEYLSSAAWQNGLAKIKPYSGHRNSDITLIILADKIEEETIKLIKKAKYYKSYKFTFYGWSNFRLLAYEVYTGKTFTNRLGMDLKKLTSIL